MTAATGVGKRSRSIGYEMFIAAVSLLSILNLVLRYAVKDEALSTVLLAMNAILSVILFIDFLNRFFTAESKSDYFLRQFGWADLLASLPLEQLKILRIFRLMRVYRVMREYGGRTIWHSLVKDRAGSALYLLLLVAVLVLEFGSLEMLRLESTSPDANITTASDALWYIIVTMSTVGYGDQYPVTNAGRVLGSLIIVLGVGIFGTLTGFLANFFVGSSATPAAEEEAAAAVTPVADTNPVADTTPAVDTTAAVDTTPVSDTVPVAVPDVDVREHLERLRALAAEQQAHIAQLELQLSR